MKFTLIFGFLFVAFLCNESHCSVKRREKRTLGTILQFFGYRIVPINPQNQIRASETGNLQSSLINSMRIQTVMPTERIQTTSMAPEIPTTSVVETFTQPLASVDGQFVPNFVPMKAETPLRIIVNDMSSISTKTPDRIMTPAVQETLPVVPLTPSIVAEKPQTSLPLTLEIESGTSAMTTVPPALQVSPAVSTNPGTLQTPPSSPSMAPQAMPIVTSLSGSPLPQLMQSMPFRIIMTAPAAADPTPYTINVPTSTETAPIDVRANLVSSNPMEQSMIKPSENIETLPLNFGLDQQFAPQMTSEKIQQNNKNIEVLRSDEVSSSFFGQQTFPPAFSIYPQFLMPPQSISERHQEIDRSDEFSSSHTAMNFNGQYYDYLTYHR